MTDILFVNQFDFEINSTEVLPLGLLSLCQVLQEKGFSSQIIDFNRIFYQEVLKYKSSYQANIECMADYLSKQNPTMISFYTMANNYHVALSLCEAIKKQHPTIITIFAGPQATAVAVETLNAFPQVDCVALGEGELTICSLVDNLKNHGLGNLQNVKGVAFRQDNQIIVADNRKNWIDVDQLPLIDFTKIDGNNKKTIDVLEMEIGRGCPFQCTYCSTSRFWGRNYRIKSVDRVINEIKEYQSKYGTKIFLFQHDLFTLNKKYVLDLCDRFITENINIRWACYARLDVIDEEMIRRMAQAGCMKLFFGLETGSPKIQNAVKKRLDVEKIFPLLDVLSDCNMRITISFIYGFPQEERKDLNETLSLMYKIKEKSYSLCKSKEWVDAFLSMLVFFSNTEITDTYFKDLEFDELGFNLSERLHSLPENILHMIKAHKEVFPQHFVTSNMKNIRFRFLSAFINTLLSALYQNYSLVQRAIKLYSEDLLTLYDNCFDKYPQHIDAIFHCFYDTSNEKAAYALLCDMFIDLLGENNKTEN